MTKTPVKKIKRVLRVGYDKTNMVAVDIVCLHCGHRMPHMELTRYQFYTRRYRCGECDEIMKKIAYVAAAGGDSLEFVKEHWHKKYKTKSVQDTALVWCLDLDD